MPANCNPEKRVARLSFSQMHDTKKVRPMNAWTEKTRPTIRIKTEVICHLLKDLIKIKRETHPLMGTAPCSLAMVVGFAYS
jgi:hypothetical protein